MGYINQLLQLATSPVGLFLLAIGGTWVMTAQPNRPPWPWLLLAFCGFAASLGEFRDEYLTEAPPLVFPLQQIRQAGRPLAFFSLGLLLVLALRTPKGWRQRDFPQPLIYLFILQGILLLKVAYSGDLGFTVLSAITYSSVIFMVVRGPSRWLQDDQSFDWAMGSLALVGAIFLGASLYQARFDTYPITYVQDQFLGTTGNPQHAAVLLMLTLPAWFYLLLRPQQPLAQRLLWAGAVLITSYALVETGSRTGVLAVVVAVLLFFGQRLRSWQWVVLLLLVFIAVLWYVDNPYLSNSVVEALPRQLVSTENTRSEVWQRQWDNFAENPFLGAPLKGERLRFGENSWLAVGAAAGVVGLVPMSLFAYYCFLMMLKLYRIGYDPRYRLQCKAVIAGLGALLVGSVFEAYLLGLITLPLLGLCVYLALGQYVLDCAERDRAWQMGAYPSLVPLAEPGLR